VHFLSSNISCLCLYLYFVNTFTYPAQRSDVYALDSCYRFISDRAGLFDYNSGNHRSSLDLLPRGADSGFNEQYKKWRRGPVAAPATAAAATRAPSGAVSVPLPRTPKENILSKTNTRPPSKYAQRTETTYIRVAVKALALAWQVRCVRESGGLTPSSIRKYRYTMEG
jgi:hypothetical protein